MAKFSGTGVRNANRLAMERLRAHLDGLSSSAIKQADKRALASVRRRFEPVAKRQIRQSYNVKASALSGGFQVRGGADSTGDFMELFARTRRVPLISFGGRWRGPARRKGGRWAAPATAEVMHGARQSYDSAFIATMRGKREVFVRQFSRDREGTASGRDPRNKVRALRGPSPYLMTRGRDDANAGAIADEMNEYRLGEVKRLLAVARRGRT